MNKRCLYIVLGLLILCCLSGCQKRCVKFEKEEAYLYEKMSAIPVEYDGYTLEKTSESDYMQLVQSQRIETTLQGEEIAMYYDRGIKILYKEKEITLDTKFMEERSDAYNEINKIWDGWNDEDIGPLKIEIEGNCVFDDKVFILTCGLHTSFVGGVKGELPYTLFYYDIINDKVYYTGFYSGEKNEYGYQGFKNNLQLTVIKK